jgi:membrane-bound serine protease (ClpP class)
MSLLVGLTLSYFFLDWPWTVVVVIPLALLEIFEVSLWMKLRKVPAKMGSHMLIGQTGEVVTDCDPRGQVRVAGQLWSATSDKPARRRTQVTILGTDGIKLEVTPAP